MGHRPRIDFLGDEDQLEELNHIVRGKQYGWPHVYGAGDIYPESTPPGGITKVQWKTLSEPMVLGYKAHSHRCRCCFTAAANFPASTATTPRDHARFVEPGSGFGL